MRLDQIFAKPNGRPRLNDDRVTSGAERKASHRNTRQVMKRRCVAVLDMETDPFDNVEELKVFPFVACLYSDQFDTVVIWEEHRERFIDKVMATIEALPDEFTIYAHNGGRFDFMFFVSRLRGQVKFKGRGIMSARIGNHELRDSFHLIPEKLAAYHKESFDYEKMRKQRRGDHKAEIVKYLISDCKYLFELIRPFIDGHGLKLSIGQAAMSKLKEHYHVEKFTENWDAHVREYFFGGRVECLRGRGSFVGDYRLYDVNSMYPYVMATRLHPVGGFFDYAMRGGPVREDTIFIDLNCKNNRALISRTLEGETVATQKEGRFFTTIWEFEVATKYNLISDVSINYTLDCSQRTDFSKFIVPMYAQRQDNKVKMKAMAAQGLEGGDAYREVKRDDTWLKFFLNNSYGKFCQNPRNYKDHYFTDPHDMPPVREWFRPMVFSSPARFTMPRGHKWTDDEIMRAVAPEFAVPEFECNDYWVWQRPAPGFNFNNVGVGASITGAARAVLLEALQHARDPIYCDTDSIIAKGLEGVEIDKAKLGAWDIEAEFDEVIITGKKTYACHYKKPLILPNGQEEWFKIRSKGSAAPSWNDLLSVEADHPVELRNRAPSLNRYGAQEYGRKLIRATAPILTRA